MSQKKKKSLTSTIIKMIYIVPRLFGYIGNIKALVKLEARLAGRSLFFIVILSLIAASLLTISWVCLLGLLFLYFQSLQWHAVSSLLVILLINIILLLGVGFKILRLKEDLLFPETCEQLKEKLL